MTNVERQLLRCLCAYRMGRRTAEIIQLLSPEEWRQLYSMAAVHKLVPVVYEMLHAVAGFCGEDISLAAAWKQEAILQAVGQTARTQKLLELTRALDEAGVRYAVVKGIICRQMYGKPDLRSSGDEDLFIPAEESAHCEKILKQLGFLSLTEQKEADVIHWRDSSTGLHVELHTRLFSLGWEAEELLNPYFTAQLERTVSVAAEQGAVRTLAPTAHLIFLIAHALKHFITGGFGIRTLADILTFCERNETQIDRKELWSMLERIHGIIFFQTLLRIGRTHMEFDIAPWGDLSPEQTDGNDLLNDMLAAGVYGQTSMDRKHGGAFALQTVLGDRTKPSLCATLFPPVSKLKGRYPVLRKAPILLPVMWAHRMGYYALDVLRSRGEGNLPQRAMALGKQRMEMMVRYGILPQAKTEDR